MKKYFSDNRFNLKIATLFFLITVISCTVLILNPGFYSHDELEIYDKVTRIGFFPFISDVIHAKPGLYFSQPYRPIPFAIEGFLSLFFDKHPWVVHLFNVITHALVSLILFYTSKLIFNNSRVALFSTIFFILNPLSIFAIGWSAALMDPLYILFTVTALFCAAKILKFDNFDRRFYLGIFFSSLAAILCKETAIVSPFIIFILLDKKILSNLNKFFKVFFIWLLPVLIYILIRLPSIFNSFNGNPNSYHPAFSNILSNLFVYIVYPFLPNIGEAHTYKSAGYFVITLALAFQVFICIFLFRLNKYKALLVYLFGYILFLSPVILLSEASSHYLYGSSLALSVALGYISYKAKYKIYTLFLVTCFLVLLIHNFNIQKMFFNTGKCMTSIDSFFKDLNHNRNEIIIKMDSNSPSWVIKRYTHQRNNSFLPKHISLYDSIDKIFLPHSLDILRFDSQCQLSALN